MPPGFLYRKCVFVAAVLLLAGLTTPRLAGSQVRTKQVRTKTAMPGTVLITVNGKRITERDLEVMMLARQIPESLRTTVRKAFIERLVDNRLMQEFLADRKIVPTQDLLDKAVRRIHQQIRRQGGKPADVLKKRGLDAAALRRELALPIAWGLFARKIIPNMEIRERFKKRRTEFDGTRIRARQIVLKLPKIADATAQLRTIKRLDAIRRDIAAGKIAFADAAKKFSTAPSKKNGGDLGFFPLRGKMPLVISRVAFSLQKDEISKPFVTPFGVHIVQVTERKPGQLSLEDARPEIFQQLSRERWNKLVAKLRKTAKIVRKVRR